MDIKTILLIPVGLILFSLLFFSPGILIFLTILCLQTHHFLFIHGLVNIALWLRWVFFTIFCLRIFGDIFLGRTVRKIKFFDVLAIVFIIYAFFSISYSPDPKVTLERATTVLALYISVFWIIWKYAYEQGSEKVVHIILQVTWIVLITSYLMIFIDPYRTFFGTRFQGIFGNPNGLGGVCSLILPLSLWQFLETKKKNAFFLFFLLLLALLLSGMRGGFQATAFALGYMIYVRSKKHRPLVLFSSVSFILIFTWIIETSIKELFKAYIRIESIPVLGGRLAAWPVALDMIVNRPILGYGFGVEDRILKFTPAILSRHWGQYIHNSYLGISLQLGLPGLIILFSPLFTLLFKELSLREKSQTSLLRYALQASLIAGLLICIYESWIYSVGSLLTFPFWIIVMLLTFYRYQDKEKSIA